MHKPAAGFPLRVLDIDEGKESRVITFSLKRVVKVFAGVYSEVQSRHNVFKPIVVGLPAHSLTVDPIHGLYLKETLRSERYRLYLVALLGYFCKIQIEFVDQSVHN